MIPPIIVYDQGDIRIFKSLEQVTKHLEPIDLEEENITVYDSQGHRLIFVIKKQKWFDMVVFDSREESLDHAQSLHNALTDYLLQLGEDENNLASLSLRDLVALIGRYQDV